MYLYFNIFRKYLFKKRKERFCQMLLVFHKKKMRYEWLIVSILKINYIVTINIGEIINLVKLQTE